MKILQRYYLAEFFKLFSIIGCGLGFIFSLMELINRINDFMPYRPSVKDLLLYSALNFPQYLLYLMPMAALISGLFVFGQAGRRKETTAVKASGGSMKKLLRPFLYSGVLLSAACFLIGEFIAPDFTARAHALKDTLSNSRKTLTFREGTTWLRTRDAIVKIDLFLPDKGIIKGISIMKMEDSMLVERIEAESAEWRPAVAPAPPSELIKSPSTPSRETGGVWYLRDVTSYQIKTGTVTKYTELQSDILDSRDIFREGGQRPDEMNVRELMTYTKKLKTAGFRNTKLIVDIHSRISYPLINVIMLVLGISLATRGTTGGGLITAAVGIFISLLYWIGYTASLSLGYAGILPPFVAAWFMPLVFGGGAWYVFRKIPE